MELLAAEVGVAFGLWTVCRQARDPFGHATRAPLDTGPRHFDYKPLRTEDADGVWVSAAANMTVYLLLKERASRFRSDPQVQDALAASGVPGLAVPTLAPGEGHRELRADPESFETFNADAAASPGCGFVHLNQLAVEHALGTR